MLRRLRYSDLLLTFLVGLLLSLPVLAGGPAMLDTRLAALGAETTDIRSMTQSLVAAEALAPDEASRVVWQLENITLAVDKVAEHGRSLNVTERMEAQRLLQTAEYASRQLWDWLDTMASRRGNPSPAHVPSAPRNLRL